MGVLVGLDQICVLEPSLTVCGEQMDGGVCWGREETTTQGLRQRAGGEAGFAQNDLPWQIPGWEMDEEGRDPGMWRGCHIDGDTEGGEVGAWMGWMFSVK